MRTIIIIIIILARTPEIGQSLRRIPSCEARKREDVRTVSQKNVTFVFISGAHKLY